MYSKFNQPGRPDWKALSSKYLISAVVLGGPRDRYGLEKEMARRGLPVSHLLCALDAFLDAKAAEMDAKTP